MNAATTARTNNQSAAIALLAANSAKPVAQSPRDDSFAQALSQANQPASKGEAGLFAARQQPANQSTKPTRSNDDAATEADKSGPTRQPVETKAPSEPENESATTDQAASNPAVKAKPSDTEPKPEFSAAELPTEAPLAPVEAAAAAETPAANIEPKPIKTARPAAVNAQPTTTNASTPNGEAPSDAVATSVNATNEADEAINPAAAATKRAPSDPLRLIPPSEQSSSASQTVTASKPIDPAAANTDTSVATRSPNSNSDDTRNSSSPTPQGFGLSQPGKTVPQSPIAGAASPVGNSAGNTIGGNSTSNTSSSTIGAPRVDSGSVPTRLPGTRAPESPINLKLTARSLPTGEATTTQTEADAAATQIARGLGAAFRNKGGQLTLWMNPESLGKLRVQMTIDNGTISARFEATSEATKNLLTQNIDALRSALESRGLSASSIDVVSVSDWSKPQDQPGGSGTRNDSNDSSFQQRGTNQNSSGQQFSHNSGARDNMPQNLSWLREPELAPAPAARAEPVAQINVNERLLAMSARLEIDAVA